jgi:hypothetical protein
MRVLMLHVDFLRSTTTERGRSSVVEDLDLGSRTIEVGESLMVLASVERADELRPEGVSRSAVVEIARLAGQLKVDTVVLHPLAHLFGELGEPRMAIRILELTQRGLIEKGFRVFRTPFGWFNTLELKAKGHPLSRVARIINPA